MRACASTSHTHSVLSIASNPVLFLSLRLSNDSAELSKHHENLINFLSPKRVLKQKESVPSIFSFYQSECIVLNQCKCGQYKGNTERIKCFFVSV